MFIALTCLSFANSALILVVITESATTSLADSVLDGVSFVSAVYPATGTSNAPITKHVIAHLAFMSGPLLVKFKINPCKVRRDLRLSNNALTGRIVD